MSKPREVVGPPTSAGFGEAEPTPALEVDAPSATPNFASDDAAELWIASDQPALGEPSGKTGYTVADVRAALREV